MKHTLPLHILLPLLMTSGKMEALAQLPASPGAEGYGSIATEGRGGDEIPNLVEYAIGTLPHKNERNPITPSIAGSHLSLSFDRLPARTDLIITVEASSTLGLWTPIARSTAGAPFTALIKGVQCTENAVDATRFHVTVTDTTSSETQRFLRIHVTN
jgi:hypothetical protein